MKGVWQQNEGKFKFVPAKRAFLPPGFYNTVSHYDGPYLEVANTHFDETLLIEDPTTKNLIETTNNFFKSENSYKQLGAVHKRGILLHGPPGTGKSSVINMLSEVIIKLKGVVLITKQNSISEVEKLMHQVRDSSPKQPLGVVMEDIETYSDNPRSLKYLLSLLSGQAQVNGVLFMATTNLDLQDLPATLTTRPSRFDIVEYVGFPNKDIKVQFLEKLSKGHLSQETINRISKSTEGLSIAHVKEIAVSHYCLNEDLEDCIERVGKMVVSTDPVSEDEEAPESFQE